MRVLLVASLLCVALIHQSPAYSAEDGLRGENRSEGRISVSLAILPSLQISVVNQISIDIRDVNVDTNFEEYVCITGNGDGRYRLIASGSNGDFVLNNEAGDELPYSVLYNGNPSGENFDELGSGKASPIYNLVGDASDCASTPNFQVRFRSEDLKTVNAGHYTGALTLLVSPL